MKIFLVITFSVSFAEKTSIKIASLEWPPYTGKALDGYGLNSIFVNEIFSAMGYDLEIIFYPWSRVIYEGKNNPGLIGYFPEYYSKEIEKHFLFSETIGYSPLGFVERKDNPIHWKHLKDLEGIPIGVVRGYVNTHEFDSLMNTKTLTVEPVVNDGTNLKKVAAGRISLAVIDKNVMNYLLENEDDLKDLKELLRFNDKLLGWNSLHVCFKKDSLNQKLMEEFNSYVKNNRKKN